MSCAGRSSRGPGGKISSSTLRRPSRSMMPREIASLLRAVRASGRPSCSVVIPAGAWHLTQVRGNSSDACKFLQCRARLPGANRHMPEGTVRSLASESQLARNCTLVLICLRPKSIGFLLLHLRFLAESSDGGGGTVESCSVSGGSGATFSFTPS